jgi:hypothetical protein
MKLLYRWLPAFLPLIACFMLQCQKTQDPEPNPTLSIKDVWISDIQDADQDGFVSSYHLNFDLDVSNGSMNVFVWLGFQVHDDADTAQSYYPYFESANFTVQGTGESDAQYIEIGPSNIELPQGAYDFLFIVFDGSEEDKRLAEVSESDDDDMMNIPIESGATDIGIYIFDAFFEDFVDQDGDGYASLATLWVDVDEEGARGSDVRLALYEKASGAGSYNFLGLTDPFTVTGEAGTDIAGIDLDGFPHGDYDFKVELLFNNSLVLEDAKEASNWSDLAGIPLEQAAEDQPQFTITFNNLVYTDIEVSVSGYGTKTALVNGSAVFNLPGNPGSFTYTAETAGYTSGDTRIGELVVWGATIDVSGKASATYNLNVSSTLFFIRMQNNGTQDLKNLYVNWGTTAQTEDNITIPNTGLLYRIGYYQAYPNLEVRAYLSDGLGGYVYWTEGDHFTLPFTLNQFVNLSWTSVGKSLVQIDANPPVVQNASAGRPFAETSAYVKRPVDIEGQTEIGHAAGQQ